MKAVLNDKLNKLSDVEEFLEYWSDPLVGEAFLDEQLCVLDKSGLQFDLLEGYDTGGGDVFHLTVLEALKSFIGKHGL